MSVSKVIADLRAKEQTALNQAQAQHDLVNKVLDAIPDSSPGPISVYNHGYCAQACINFSGEGIAHRLYELYPPMDCVDVKGGSQSQKPAKYVRAEEMRDNIRPIFPVVFKTSKDECRATWWTELEGTDVVVNVVNAVKSEFAAELGSGKYETDSHTYHTGAALFFPRALATPKVRPGEFVAWIDAWQSFGKGLGFNEEQLKFMKAAGRYVHIQHTPHMDHYDRVHGEGCPTREQLAGLHNSPGMHCDRFTELFWEEEQDKVLAFAQQQSKALYGALGQQGADFDAVQMWFANFFAQWGYLNDSDYDTKERIEYKLRKDTGLDVSIRILRPGRGTVSVSPYFKGFEQYPDWVFPLSTAENAPRLKPQDIEVEYL